MKTIRASSIPTLMLCPGKLTAERDLKDPGSAEASSGTKIHMALQLYFEGVDFDLDVLDSRESMVYHWFKHKANDIFEAHGGLSRVHPEYPFKADLGDGYQLTGHVDLVAYCKDDSLHIIDYKTGRNEVTEANANTQMFAYALGVTGGVIEDDLFVHLFAAGNDEPFTSCELCNEDLIGIKEMVQKIAVGSHAPHAPRTPGSKQCEYCRACMTGRCPESINEANKVVKVEAGLPESVEEACEIREKLKLGVQLAKKYEYMFKEDVLSNPEKWKNHYTTKEGNVVRSISDVQGAFQRVVELQELVDKETFLSAVEMKIGTLEKLLKAPLTEAGIKAKDQKEYIENMLEGLINRKQNMPSIVKVKP